MMHNLQNYLLSLIGIGFISAVAQALIPQGTTKKCVVFVCGLLLIIAAIRPIGKIDYTDLARAISQMEIQSSESCSGIETENQKIISGIIKEKSETYIWDKATELGMHPKNIHVEVTADASYPYPYRVLIQGEFTQQQRIKLSEWMERELAIEINHQEWQWNES